MTTTTLAGSAGYTFNPIYDPTNGVLQGLSNSSTTTANLATLTYNEYAQLASIAMMNGASSSPANLASEQFSYDANLRPTSLTANWLPGSGNSGQILAQGRAYDNASNVTGANTTFAAVPGQTGSGGSEVQNFCYDEQNRLIWAGNGGTQPGAGNGTCGSGTLSSGLSGAGYTAPFSYTNLGQIWQGPVNGQGAAQQYLYCNSAPHQLTGIYPLGITCANKGSATASYSAGYDPWGNLSSRTYKGITATLSYDALNQLSEYNAGSSGQEFYAYDVSGNRILKRSISAGNTTLAVYAFGLEEYDYSGTGALTSQLHYYSLAGHLIGSFDGTNITFYLTDTLGTVLISFSQSAILGEQIYGPYGNQRYTMGNINTAKGYTGQLCDAVTGLDYYNARYYDPVVGVFLSIDSVQGNGQGMDPYAYVGGNPETLCDPTGHDGINWGWVAAAAVVVGVAVACVVAPEVMLPAIAAVGLASAPEGVVGVGIGMFVGMGASVGGDLAADALTGQIPTPTSLVNDVAMDITGGGLLGAISPINPVTDGGDLLNPVDVGSLNEDMSRFATNVARNGIYGGVVGTGLNVGRKALPDAYAATISTDTDTPPGIRLRKRRLRRMNGELLRLATVITGGGMAAKRDLIERYTGSLLR